MNICKNCKHCKHPFRSKYSFEYKCKLHTKKINYITSVIEYDDCNEINQYGCCKDYKPSVLTRIKSFFGL